MKRVLLVSMPFASTKWPSIGISLLKPRLREAGIPCDIRYLNITFASMAGLELYEDISLFPRNLIGERLFAADYFGSRLPGELEYHRFLQGACQGAGYTPDNLREIMRLRQLVAPFLDRCMTNLPWEQYDVVGFTSMFEQNMASLSLARRIKERYPEKTIIFGGANCEGVMGLELHRQFPFIDYVCSSESDHTLPMLINRISRGESVAEIPAIVHRETGSSVLTSGHWIVENLDELPFPDYDDYFTQLAEAGLSDVGCSDIHMESSRGCWWGAKSQCSFCGLNGHSIGYRSKSAERILAEIDHISERYVKPHNLALISMVDNILGMKHFQELIPALAKKELPAKLFYEVKANLNREQVKMLADAGVAWVQPGIESLSSHVLKLMAKGVTPLQNLQLLKHCRQFGVYPTWNIIYKSPGEMEEDYRQMTELISSIPHLTPPEAVIPLCLQRFSPYFNHPDQYGITNIRPEKAYRFVYPFSESVLRNLAYFFEFDYTRDAAPPERIKELSSAVDQWRACYANSESLYAVAINPDCLVIEDWRSVAVHQQLLLEASHKNIYEYCDSVRSFSAIYAHIRKKYSDYPVKPRDILDFLEEMVALKLMANDGDSYLSLAIPVDHSGAVFRQAAM